MTGVAEGEPGQGGGTADGRSGGPQVRAHRRRRRRRRRHRLLHRRVVQVQPPEPHDGHPRGAAPRTAPELRPGHGAHGRARARPLLRQRRRNLAGPEVPRLLRDADVSSSRVMNPFPATPPHD
jgi:hypothetical protein